MADPAQPVPVLQIPVPAEAAAPAADETNTKIPVGDSGVPDPESSVPSQSGVSTMPQPDPAVTLDSGTLSILTGAMNRGIVGELDSIRVYVENVRYDYLTTKNEPSVNQAHADRVMDESGSGRARGLDTSNTAPALAK
jgi:hypothetical protein